MVAEADYCWFVGWGFTGARPSSQQVKPNDLARVLQQSRHYLMQHDTCNQILDKWNIDKKVHFCLFTLMPIDQTTLLHIKLRSICAQSVTKNHPILAMPVRVMAVDLLFVAIKTTHGSLPVLKSVNLHTVVRLPFSESHQSSHASQCLKIGLTK